MAVNVETWQMLLQCPETGILWKKYYPNSGGHGGQALVRLVRAGACAVSRVGSTTAEPAPAPQCALSVAAAGGGRDRALHGQRAFGARRAGGEPARSIDTGSRGARVSLTDGPQPQGRRERTITFRHASPRRLVGAGTTAGMVLTSWLPLKSGFITTTSNSSPVPGHSGKSAWKAAHRRRGPPRPLHRGTAVRSEATGATDPRRFDFDATSPLRRSVIAPLRSVLPAW
jgi:hypothetical protein